MITIPMTVSATNETVPMSVSGSGTIPMDVGAQFAPVPDVYDGPTDITPSMHSVTLPTNGKTMPADVTIDAMRAGSATTPSASYDETMMLSVSPAGVVSGTKAVTKAITPIVVPGYVSQGTAGNVTVNVSSSVQLPTKAAETFEPGAVAQTISENQYLTGAQIIQPWKFLGIEAEFVEEIYPKTSVKLKDTLFNGWTPSTTAKTIVSSSTLSGKAFTGDFSQYEYLLRWRWSVDVAYKSGATLKVQIYRPCGEVWQIACKRPSSLANIGSENFNGNTCLTYFTAALLTYYNSTGGLANTWSATYGLYASVTACTFGSSTADSTTVTPKTPTWNARCSTTYMSTTRAAEIDQDNTSLIMRGELWRIKKKSAVREMLENCCDIYNDHLNP